MHVGLLEFRVPRAWLSADGDVLVFAVADHGFIIRVFDSLQEALAFCVRVGEEFVFVAERVGGSGDHRVEVEDRVVDAAPGFEWCGFDEDCVVWADGLHCPDGVCVVESDAVAFAECWCAHQKLWRDAPAFRHGEVSHTT